MSMRQIYRKVAKENGVSMAEVKRDMQTAINYAYEHTPDDGITVAYQNQVRRKDVIPTTDEFIRHAVCKTKAKIKDR